MFIRRPRTRADGGYLTFRPVRSERIGNKVRQPTLPDPGRHFDVAQGHRPMLCRCIDEIPAGRLPLSTAGHCDGWAALRRILEGQRRVAAVFRRDDGRTPHVRKATRPEASPLSVPSSASARSSRLSLAPPHCRAYG